MGLDITAYKNVELIEVLPNHEAYEDKYIDEWDKYDYIHPQLHFSERLPPLQEGGVYTFEDMFCFRAGSYGGYNWWREVLAEMALGVAPSEVWENPDRFTGMPFVELINFSDCAGYLGSEVCKKLLKDFEMFAAKAKQQDHEYFYRSYQDWHKAFKMASSNGFIEFH